MRMQLDIPPHLSTALKILATTEHRYPRQQAECLLCRAIERALTEYETAQDRSLEAFLEESTHAPAP